MTGRHNERQLGVFLPKDSHSVRRNKAFAIYRQTACHVHAPHDRYAPSLGSAGNQAVHKSEAQRIKMSTRDAN